jgi:hypothetical protein
MGMEKDLLKMKKKEVGRNDNLLVGVCYGYAFQKQGVPRFLIKNDYWDDYVGEFAGYTVNTHWLQISMGPRVEMLKNFFMGWHLNILFTVYQNNDGIISPYIVPGYGNGGNKVNASFSYNIEYLIPWRQAKINK